MIFVWNGILDREELALDISTWFYKYPPPRNQELHDYFGQKYPHSHHLATKKWAYQGGNIDETLKVHWVEILQSIDEPLQNWLFSLNFKQESASRTLKNLGKLTDKSKKELE